MKFRLVVEFENPVLSGCFRSYGVTKYFIDQGHAKYFLKTLKKRGVAISVFEFKLL